MPIQAKLKAQPLDLPAISRSAVAQLNAAARKREPWQGSLGAEFVAITSADPHQLWQEEDIWCGLRLTLNEAPIRAYIPFHIIQGQVHHIDNTIDLELLDPESLGILVEAIFEPFLQTLETEYHFSLVCAGIDFASEYPEGELYGLITETESWNRQPLILQLPSAWGKRIQAWLNTFPMKKNSIEELLVPVSFRAGTALLTLDDLINLRPGDGIVLDENSVTRKAVIAVVGEVYAQTCLVTSTGLELTDTLFAPITGNLKGWTFMSDFDETYPGGSGTEPGAVGQINVKLVFEVGRQDLTVHELQEIDTGHIFDLGRPVGQAVDILAGGRKIGAGELVRIGDEIGVRVDWILK